MIEAKEREKKFLHPFIRSFVRSKDEKKKKMNCQSPVLESPSGSSSPSLSVSTDGFNRLQAFQVYLEMSGTIDCLTDCITQLQTLDASTSASPLEQFKTILRAKMPQIIQADCLQEEIDQLKTQVEQLKTEN